MRIIPSSNVCFLRETMFKNAIFRPFFYENENPYLYMFSQNLPTANNTL